MRYLTIALLISTMVLLAQDPPSTLREHGLALLKEAQATPDKIVDAAKLLAQAADGFAAEGKEADAERWDSYSHKKVSKPPSKAFFAASGESKTLRES